MPAEWVSTFKLSVCLCVCVCLCVGAALCVYWCAARLGQVCLEVNYLGTRPSHPSTLTAPRWDAHKYATLCRGGVMKTNFAHCKSQSRARHKIFNNNYRAQIKKRAHRLARTLSLIREATAEVKAVVQTGAGAGAGDGARAEAFALSSHSTFD